jgi:hypothetical protein
MAVEITINSITGTEDYDVYICDDLVNNCIYYTTIQNIDLPYVFFAPPPLDNLTEVCVKIIDSNGCEIIQCIS